MKYIITELQIDSTVKQLNKDKAEKGKLSKIIEELALSFLGDKEICDIVATETDHTYILLILIPEWIGYKVDEKLEKHIEDFLGINVMVIVANSKDCERMTK
jgi:nucleoid-associated protein YejK